MARSGAGHSLQQALALHEQGRIAEAAARYREIIAGDPQNAEALHLLGVAELQAGNTESAVNLIGRAIGIESRNANYHSNFGLALSHAGRFEEALASFDRALAINPNSANTLNHRGNVLRNMGRLDEALAAYARALTISPQHADALNNRGAVLADMNRMEEAFASLDRALAVDRDHAGALGNRGALRVRLKQFREGLADLNRAKSLHPANPVVLNNRGNALCGLKRYDEAISEFERALVIDPRYADAWFNRGTVCSELRRFGEAISNFERALSLDPGRVDALVNQAHAFSELGQLDRAYADYDRAMAIAPDQELLAGWRIFCKLKMCDWREVASEIAKIEAGMWQGKTLCSPAVMLALPGSPELLRRCAEGYVQRYLPGSSPVKPDFSVGADRLQAPPTRKRVPRFRPPRQGEADQVRLGYFSADFHAHATAHLMAGVLEHHDRGQFEITAFSFGPPKQDQMRKRVENACDRFIDISGITDAEAAQLARRAGIDIAVDLKGFTEGSRSGIFALRAAPVQVSYLGYPGTMGADYIDYLIADGIVLPGSAQKHYREKIAWLPECYQPNDSNRMISTAAMARHHFGLPEGDIVFCCFNNNYKIMPDVFDIWMRLLTCIERSVLWLLEDNPFAARNLRSEAQMRGVHPERLIFATRISQADHLARHRLADLFLDTLPYNAHTTASDALWAGLPVLTCLGGGFQGRVAASLLQASGLSELITENPRAYEAAALRLARNPHELRALSERLIVNRDCQPLFDTARYTKNLEAAFREMWGQYLSGQPPEAFHV